MEYSDKRSPQRLFIFNKADEICGAQPEYMWARTPDAAVLRRRDNSKWFGLVMTVRRGVLEKDCAEPNAPAEILNVKCDPLLIGSLLMEECFYPAYHMNKQYWITILLNAGVEDKKIAALLEMSYELTENRGKKRQTKKDKQA